LKMFLARPCWKSYMEAENNQSPSFQYLMDELKRIV